MFPLGIYWACWTCSALYCYCPPDLAHSEAVQVDWVSLRRRINARECIDWNWWFFNIAAVSLVGNAQSVEFSLLCVIARTFVFLLPVFLCDCITWKSGDWGEVELFWKRQEKHGSVCCYLHCCFSPTVFLVRLQRWAAVFACGSEISGSCLYEPVSSSVAVPTAKKDIWTDWGLIFTTVKTESDILFPSAISPPPFHAKVYLPANCCCPSGPAAGLLTSPLLRHPSGMLATMSALMLPTTATVAAVGAAPAPHVPLLAVPPKPILDGTKFSSSNVTNKSGQYLSILSVCFRALCFVKGKITCWIHA